MCWNGGRPCAEKTTRDRVAARRGTPWDRAPAITFAVIVDRSVVGSSVPAPKVEIAASAPSKAAATAAASNASPAITRRFAWSTSSFCGDRANAVTW